MAVSDWSTNADLNTSIDDIDISEHCPAKNMNDALRHVMAGVKGLADDAGHGYYVTDIEDVPADAKTGSTIFLEGTGGVDVYTVNESLEKVATGASKLDKAGGTITGNLSVNGNISAQNLTGTVPVGTVLWSMAASVPSGFLLCNGSAVGRTTYPALFAAIGTTYGAGDGSTTFNLPNLIGKFLEGSATAGEVKEPGLPNITGVFRVVSWSSDANATSGAFYNGPRSVDRADSAGASCGGSTYNFNASRSSPVYGRSTTVQPPAVTALPVIKAFDSTTNTSSVDVSGVAADCARKEEVNSSGDGWVRYESGLQMCWGVVTLESDTNTTVTIPKAFKDMSWAVPAVPANINQFIMWGSIVMSTTTFKIFKNNANMGGTATYLAIGRWK